MAKLNGVEMKTYKTFRDHEGIPISQATIYIDGKKAGFWSQDSWGGPDQYESRTMINTIDERAKAFQKGCPTNYKYYDVMNSADCFMSILLKLCDHEKAYKTFAKKGFSYMVAMSNGNEVLYTAFNHPVTKEWVETGGISIPMQMKNKIYKYGDPNFYYMNSLDDFNITVNDNSPCPEWLLKD